MRADEAREIVASDETFKKILEKIKERAEEGCAYIVFDHICKKHRRKLDILGYNIHEFVESGCFEVSWYE